MAVVVTLCLVLTLLITLYYIRKRKYFQLGSKLPGPKPWPFVGNAFDFFGDTSDILRKLTEISDKYEVAAIWLGPNLKVFLRKPEHVEIFLTSPKLLDRGDEFQVAAPVLGKGMITANGSDWKRGQKKIARSFTASFIRQYVRCFKQQSDILVSRLQVQAGKPSFDVFSYMKNCTFDIVCESMMEMKMNAQYQEVKVLKMADRLMGLMYGRVYKIWQQSDLIFKLTRDGQEHDSRVEFIKSFATEQIMTKKKELESLKMNKERSNRTGLVHQLLLGDLDLDEIRDHVLTMVTAGYDTTSVTASLALVMLALHPDVQEKAYEEARKVHEGLQDGEMTADDLQKLQYVDMVVHETLRLYPAASIIFRKVNEDIEIGNYVIPKDASLGINIFNVHLDPELFENPKKFDPDRFLPEKMEARNPYSYIPFGGGPRTCIGSKFALWTLKTIISTVLCKYKVECDYAMEDIQLHLDIVLRIKGGFNIRIIERK